MSDFVSLYDAKTGLSKLVDRAAAGEEIVITKNGVPMAKLVLVAAPRRGKPRRSAHALGLKQVPADFDDPSPAEIEDIFYGRR